MQPRWLSLLEAAVNVVAGLVLAFLLQLALFDVMAIAVSLGQSLVLTLAFAALSLVRSFVLRRLFNRLGRERRTPRRTQPRLTGSTP